MRAAEKIYDVCLLLEGHYPFVASEVSIWLHNLISGLPDVQFTGICILPSSKTQWAPKYKTPPNFQDIQVLYLHDPVPSAPDRLKRTRSEQMTKVREFHTGLREQNIDMAPEIVAAFNHKEYPLYNLIHGKASWDFVVESYNPEKNQESFIDYFWTFRISHLPIFKVLSVPIPKARVYHAISTGYAGLLGVAAQIEHHRPLILTEQDISFKEREIDSSQAALIFDGQNKRQRFDRKLSSFQDIWTRVFQGLSLLTYKYCERIFTFSEANKLLEIAQGAPPERIEIIHNGVELGVYQKLAAQRRFEPNPEVLAIGFVCSVALFEEVKTFLRACKIVTLRLNKLTVTILAPTEEDEAYFEDCKKFVELLELQDVVEYTGKVSVLEYFSTLDLIVLTSASEGQALLILQANGSGLPAVASDVGACRELLEGRTEEDRALGPSGLVTRASDPMDTARAILEILSDHELRQRMSVSGVQRVARFYNESDLNKKYSAVYQHYAQQPDKEGV